MRCAGHPPFSGAPRRAGQGLVTRQFFGLRLLLRNLRALFLFELAYKCAASLLATPFLLLLFHLSMRAAGLKYLSNDNVLTFLTAPLPLCGIAPFSFSFS
ncbi:MAG: hypothetical protein EOM69_08905 [Clostridia bacterium]|nr:hypothetical protein [Clostridia bacterium]